MSDSLQSHGLQHARLSYLSPTPGACSNSNVRWVGDAIQPSHPLGCLNWALILHQGFPGGTAVKNLPAMQETRVWSLGREDPLEKEMATHSNSLAWRIPWTEEPGGYSPWGCKQSDTTEWLNNSSNRAPHSCQKALSSKGGGKMASPFSHTQITSVLLHLMYILWNLWKEWFLACITEAKLLTMDKPSAQITRGTRLNIL